MAAISVIVPVYKVEPFLCRCVDSILAQTYADFSLILVDDGSPDNCGAICDRYAEEDGRIHVIHQSNGGLSAARNAAIDWEFAKGSSQWLTFVDSDDWLHPAFLEKLLDGAQRERCKISVCGFHHTDGTTSPEDLPSTVQCLTADEYYCTDAFGNAVPAACGKLYHRSLFETLRYPVGRLHEDEFTTYLAVYQAGCVAVVQGCLYAYYQNPEGITHSRWNPRRLDVLDAFEGQILFAQKNGHRKLQEKAVEALIYSICSQLKEAQKVFHKELRRRLRRALKLGRELDCGLDCGRLHWAYEEAYPCRVLWWIAGKVRRA